MRFAPTTPVTCSAPPCSTSESVRIRPAHTHPCVRKSMLPPSLSLPLSHSLSLSYTLLVHAHMQARRRALCSGLGIRVCSCAQGRQRGAYTTAHDNIWTTMCARACVRAWIRACVRACVRVRARSYVCRACACACVRACVRACVWCVCVCVCVCVQGRSRSCTRGTTT